MRHAVQRLGVKKELSFDNMAQDGIPQDALQAEQQPKLESMTSWHAFVSHLQSEDELSMMERGLHTGQATASIEVRPVAKAMPQSYMCKTPVYLQHLHASHL